MAERVIEVGGVALWSGSFGDRADPPILLVMGIGASMLWCEEGFCRLLADGGRFVIRYDHRDTGRSVTYEPGQPEYSGADLVADTAGVLDACDIAAAHVVGVSAGGAFAQLLALGSPDRVLSLALISTSPATPGERQLPPPSERYQQFLETADGLVGSAIGDRVPRRLRAHARRRRASVRRDRDHELIRRDVERAQNIASSDNHGLVADGDAPSRRLSSIGVPALVIHGSADPLFPREHGQALAEEIPGARLLRLEGAGHGVERADWGTIADAILAQTAGDRGSVTIIDVRQTTAATGARQGTRHGILRR